jgi:hypothetical protein
MIAPTKGSPTQQMMPNTRLRMAVVLVRIGVLMLDLEAGDNRASV